ncbi:MAG: MarR family transcriptional regulator [Myxococcota bacterium]
MTGVSHVIRHLIAVSAALRVAITEGLVERGHRLTPSVTELVPNLPAEGLGMSALAERAGVSVQRAGQLVAQLEADGYVERVADPADGRARRVVYTRRGRKLLTDIDALLDEATDQLVGILGKARYERLLRDLADLDAALADSERGLRMSGR